MPKPYDLDTFKELFVCTECYSLVLPSFTEQHKEWHKAIDKVEGAGSKRTQSTNFLDRFINDNSKKIYLLANPGTKFSSEQGIIDIIREAFNAGWDARDEQGK